MKKQFFIAILLSSATIANACTNFIVGKKASLDGSVMCTYNADDYGMFQNLCHYPAAKFSKGAMRQIYDWDTGVYHGKIPESSETYNVIGNINEYQVTIGETTYGGREEMVDSTGILDYGSLIYIALQRSKTAREAIKTMTSLTETYGYNSEGETFTICDPNEAWILEMQGCGGDKTNKVVWVAVRIPDNAICGHANQSRIGQFHQYDGLEVISSKNAVNYAIKKGWYKGAIKDFNWKRAYAFPDFSGRRICDARVWSFFNHYQDMRRYLPWAEGKDPNAEDMPLFIIPTRKLSVQDLERDMRDHFEGTPLAVDSTDIGGGIWQMPYRPTPLYFTVNGKKYFNERPTSTQQTGFTYVSQMRSWLPRKIGGVLWFGNDDGNMVAYTPIYCGNTIQPECYNTPNTDALTFSDKNAFWVCNWVSNMVYPRYSQMFPSLKTVRDSLEASYFAQQNSVEEHALALYKSDENAAMKFLNEYSNKKAEEMLIRWKQLAVYLIVKYNDMAVKPEKNGHFLRTTTGLGEHVVRPGYPESFAKKLVESSKQKFEIPNQ